MNDRFKFRAVLHQNKYEEYLLEKFSHQRVFDVMSINLGIEYSTIEIIAEYPNGDWAVREIDDKDIDLIQCTGKKDINGKLIYEDDIVELKAKNGMTFQYVVKFKDYCFILEYINGKLKGKKARNFAKQYAQPQRMYEHGFMVIGNIHQNKDLLNA